MCHGVSLLVLFSTFLCFVMIVILVFFSHRENDIVVSVLGEYKKKKLVSLHGHDFSLFFKEVKHSEKYCA